MIKKSSFFAEPSRERERANNPKNRTNKTDPFLLLLQFPTKKRKDAEGEKGVIYKRCGGGKSGVVVGYFVFAVMKGRTFVFFCVHVLKTDLFTSTDFPDAAVAKYEEEKTPGI